MMLGGTVSVAASSELLIRWHVEGDRPVRATLISEGEVTASVTHRPPQGWPAGSGASLAAIVEEAFRKSNFGERLQSELQHRGRGLWDSLFPGDVGEKLADATAQPGTRRRWPQPSHPWLRTWMPVGPSRALDAAERAASRELVGFARAACRARGRT